MDLLQIVLYIVATIFIVLEAFGVRPARVSLGWLGLAIFVFTIGVLPALA